MIDIYNAYNTAVENVQRKFLKYLCYKIDGIYPPRGLDQSELLSRFNLRPLSSLRSQAAVIFVYKLLNGSIDCSVLLSQLNLQIPRINSRNNLTFLCNKAQTNLMSKAPINFMCINANKLSAVCDIFSCSITELKDMANVYL